MNDDKIIIYGAGDFGKRLFNFLQKFNIFVEFFCQSNVVEEKRLFDIPIISIDQLRDISEKKIILIAIANREVSKKIKLQLTSTMIEDIEVYECSDFIEKNLFQEENKNYCLLCNFYIKEFLEAGRREEIFSAKTIIGGGYRPHSVCPHCNSVDRERWVFYVLNKYTGVFTDKCSVLHVAPEKMLENRIRSNDMCDYYSCDIMPRRAMHVVDVTDIQFKDETFDYIIINHVLEHVIDEQKAIEELKRVLKPSGVIIMSFPICKDEETFEDSSIIKPEDRSKFYGQDDHVRLYGYDYRERLEGYGLKLQVYEPIDICTETEIGQYGFIPDDVLIVATLK